MAKDNIRYQLAGTKMVYLVLPAFNEGKGIAAQLFALRDFIRSRGIDYRIVAVDDGSRDDTAQQLEMAKGEVNLEVLRHEVNRGPGEAFKSGFDYIYPRLNPQDVVVTMDSDNTQNINTLGLMLDKINQGYDLAIGSIFVQGGKGVGIPFIRLLMSCGVCLLYKLLFPIKGVMDYTVFYRAIRGSALKTAYAKFGRGLIESPGFGCMAEMLIKFRMIPISICEVPVIIRYDLKTSRSKLKILPTIKEHLGIIGRNIFRKGKRYDY